MTFDEQELLILKALIRDPRMSDNRIGKLTGVPIRTVSRKRQRLEKLVGHLESGPPSARVARVVSAWSEYTGDYAGFSIGH